MSVADKIASSVAQVEACIEQAAQKMADARAQEIDRVSGGTVAPNTEQLAALKSNAAAELADDFAKQVASVANTFIVTNG